jgi:SacI restriction endonuclease
MIAKVERLSQLCDQGVSKTHIAFLGTAMLAKATDNRVDLFAIKPEHAGDNPNAFSARTLCHSVLVPLAAKLGINLGVTGREPLNNQPYFRMTRLDDGTPVHAGGRAAFDYMVNLVRELQNLKSEEEAFDALRAFLVVRRNLQPRYVDFEDAGGITPEKLAAAIASLVIADSEGGKRAQAVVAGLLDVFAGPARVESGRINDPSRKYPGDVCVRSSKDPDAWEKAFEVRDKPVVVSDVQIFGKKCVDMGVRESAVVMVSDRQPLLSVPELTMWAAGFGLGLTLFKGWSAFIEQVLFWSALPKFVAAAEAVRFIHARLLAVEASPKALSFGRR